MDDFSDLSWKAAFLLQLPPGSGVLVAGFDEPRLRAGFEKLGYSCRTFEEAKSHTTSSDTISAAVILPGSTVKLHSMIEVLRALQGDVQVLAFFNHRWNAFRGIRNGLRSLLSTDAYTVGRVRASLRSSGFDPLGTWLPLPRFSHAEEYVSAAARDEVAASLASEPGIMSSVRARLHDGFGVYAVRGEYRGIEALARAFAEKISSSASDASFEITRFDLRERGALVLFLEDRKLKKSYVCRVVRHGQAFDHLQRHWEYQRAVKEDVAVDPELSRSIPATTLSLALGEHHAWIEERAQGTVSWRIAPSLRSTLDAQIVEFLLRLGLVSGKSRPVQVADFEREGRMWADQVASRIPLRLSDTIDRVVNQLAANFAGVPATFGWIHGDYGYGNVLASAASGQLSSVIDWETASRDSFIGVDLFNFLLQRARIEGAVTLAQAVGTLLEDIQRGTFVAREASRRHYCEKFLLDPRTQLMVLGVTLCRWGLREYRYTLTQAPDAEDLIQALEKLSSAVATLDASSEAGTGRLR